jgi:hypothetical protein
MSFDTRKLFRTGCMLAIATMPLTLKAIDKELQRLGHDVHLEKGDGYFFFWKGEANDWLDRTVNVPKVSNLTLEQWIDEFNRLKKVNEEMLAGKVPEKKDADPKSPGAKPRKSRT